MRRDAWVTVAEAVAAQRVDRSTIMRSSRFDATLTLARPVGDRRARSGCGRVHLFSRSMRATLTRRIASGLQSRGTPCASDTGPAAGRSQLAEEVAGRTTSRFTDGVWLVELARLGTGGPVAHGGGRVARPAAPRPDDRAERHRVPEHAPAAAGPRQLRARPRRGGTAGGGRRDAVCGRDRAGHQPRAAGRGGRAAVGGGAAAGPGREHPVRAAGPDQPARLSGPTTRPTGRSPRSAGASTGCRWGSSWPRPGCGS